MVDVISLRLSEEQLRAVDDLVRSGEFGTRAEFVKYCVRMTLKDYSGRSPPPLGAEKVKWCAVAGNSRTCHGQKIHSGHTEEKPQMNAADNNLPHHF